MKSILKANACHDIYTNHCLRIIFLMSDFLNIFIYRLANDNELTLKKKDRLRNALIESVVVTFSLSKRLFRTAQLLSCSNPGPLQS